jgi:hypothetical protein
MVGKVVVVAAAISVVVGAMTASSAQAAKGRGMRPLSSVERVDSLYDESSGLRATYNARLGDLSIEGRDMPSGQALTGQFVHWNAQDSTRSTLGGTFNLCRGAASVQWALGGLYDNGWGHMILGDSLYWHLRGRMAPLTIANFCSLMVQGHHTLHREEHRFPTSIQLTAEDLAKLDEAMHFDPKVVSCTQVGQVIMFDEIVRQARESQGEEHVIGGFRFLSGAYSSVSWVSTARSSPTAQLVSDVRQLLEAVTIAPVIPKAGH